MRSTAGLAAPLLALILPGCAPSASSFLHHTRPCPDCDALCIRLNVTVCYAGTSSSVPTGVESEGPKGPVFEGIYDSHAKWLGHC